MMSSTLDYMIRHIGDANYIRISPQQKAAGAAFTMSTAHTTVRFELHGAMVEIDYHSFGFPVTVTNLTSKVSTIIEDEDGKLLSALLTRENGDGPGIRELFSNAPKEARP